MGPRAKTQLMAGWSCGVMMFLNRRSKLYPTIPALDVPSLIPGRFPDVKIGTNRQFFSPREKSPQSLLCVGTCDALCPPSFPTLLRQRRSSALLVPFARLRRPVDPTQSARVLSRTAPTTTPLREERASHLLPGCSLSLFPTAAALSFGRDPGSPRTATIPLRPGSFSRLENPGDISGRSPTHLCS